MLTSQKNVFWQALLVTLLIFGIGIVFGIILENWRVGKVDEMYQKSELDLLDIKLQTEIYSMGDFDCESAVKENFLFAERIYEEAKQLERYESASSLGESLITRHRKYDILRVNLFLNSLRIKDKCGQVYHDVLYIYKYNNQTLDDKAKQNVFSKLLTELKQNSGSDILLIPFAGDNNVVSVNLLMDKYGVSKEQLPIIIIDEKIKITELETVEELQKSLESSNKNIKNSSSIIRL
jgi:hypothetical protein